LHDKVTDTDKKYKFSKYYFNFYFSSDFYQKKKSEIFKNKILFLSKIIF